MDEAKLEKTRKIVDRQERTVKSEGFEAKKAIASKLKESKVVIKKKQVKMSEVEFKRLEEKYEDPEKKRGNERSHVGSLSYQIIKLRRG